MSKADDRRYSREEFALVLRRAAELQNQRGEQPAAGDSIAGAEGMSLAEMQAVARDVGIDPARVADAAALLPKAEQDALTRYLGGPFRYSLERSVPGALPPRASGRVLEAIRRAAADQGKTSEVHGALEWRHSDEVVKFGVNVTPHDEHTNIQVVLDRGGAGFLVGFLTFIPLLLAFVITGASLELGLAAGLSLFAGLTVIWQFGARALMRRNSAKWRALAEQVLDASAHAVHEHAEQRALPAAEGAEDAGEPS